MKANTMPNRISQGSHIPCIHEGALVYVYDNEGTHGIVCVHNGTPFVQFYYISQIQWSVTTCWVGPAPSKVIQVKTTGGNLSTLMPAINAENLESIRPLLVINFMDLIAKSDPCTIILSTAGQFLM